jgi:hypothetical protein
MGNESKHKRGPLAVADRFQDEARFGRTNDMRRCWAPKPMRPLSAATRSRK